MTLNELAYRIIGLYRAKHKNTDNLSIRLIKSWINSTRALLLRQKLDKQITGIDEALVQSIGPLTLEEIDSSIFESIESLRYMKRTTTDVPEPIMRRGSIPGFVRVGPADRLETKFRVVSHEAALFSGYGKFNSKDIYCFYLDNRIYFISKDWNYFKHLDYVDVRGVFHDPLVGDDDPYPITGSMIEQIENYIVQNKLPLVMSGMADEVANERDDIVNLPPPQSE